MSEPRDTHVVPENALKGATNLTTSAENMVNRAKGIMGNIISLHGGRPWGSDDAGEEFNKNYLAGEAPAAHTIDGAAQLLQTLNTCGPTIHACVSNTMSLDEAIATWFPKSE